MEKGHSPTSEGPILVDVIRNGERAPAHGGAHFSMFTRISRAEFSERTIGSTIRALSHGNVRERGWRKRLLPKAGEGRGGARGGGRGHAAHDRPARLSESH